MYSECAHTRGQAEPDGFPRNNSRAGISARSHTCSGMRRPPSVDSSITRNKSSAACGRPAAHVISLDAALLREVAILRVAPALYIVIPAISRLTQVRGRFLLSDSIAKVGGCQQSGNFNRQRERRVAGVFLPAVLLSDWTVSHNKFSCTLHQFPPTLQVAERVLGFAPQHVNEQNGESSFIHLHAAPVGAPIKPQILCPVAVRLLRGFQIAKHAQGVQLSTSGKKSEGCFHQVARPDQMIASQIFVAFVESPGNGETGDYGTEEIFRLMRTQYRYAGPIQVALTRWLIQL